MTCIQSGLVAPEVRLPVVQIQHQVRQDILFLRRLKVEDVTDTLNLALRVSGCDTARVGHKPRLLSHNLQRERIKGETTRQRRLQYQQQAA
jgi:hypothetical protein